MGMAASQARLLGLQARQTNLEYQGQQINQERTILSQQCTALYNSLLTMEVPTPPSTQDFTTIEYSGSDGATNFTIGTVKPSGETYSVEIKTSQTGNALQSDYGSKVVTQAGEKVKCSKVDTSNEVKIKPEDINNYFIKDDNNNVIKLNSSNVEQYFVKNEDGTYTLKSENNENLYKQDTQGQEELTNPNAGKITVGGNVVYTFDEAEEIYGDRFSWADYKEAIVNTFGTSNESLDADDFYLYVHTSETGVDSIKFALRSDVGEMNAEGTLVGDGFAKTYSYTPNGTFTSSAPTEGCRLQFDTQGRITTVSIPQYDTENNIIGYRDVELTAKTSTDEKAYQDAYNQYEYKQYEYDKAQQDVNRKTEIIQQEDRNLELKLQRLDNERTQITTEIEAVEKVIQENIESSYKTFSG